MDRPFPAALWMLGLLVVLTTGCVLDLASVAGGKGGLAYFLATEPSAERPSSWESAEFSPISGESLRFSRERAPRQRIAWEAIRSVRIREGHPTLTLGRPSSFFLVELEVVEPLAARFLNLQTENPSRFLFVESGMGRAIDYLPLGYGVRRARAGEDDSAWVAGGTFESRGAAEAFYARVDEERTQFVPLGEASREETVSETRQLLEYGIWMSVCDPSALAAAGAGLAEGLEGLPDSARRRAEVNCAAPPSFGSKGPVFEDIERSGSGSSAP
ncbi:MAG: hypothetical protein AB8G23_09940 [Myxococcota bacterium]